MKYSIVPTNCYRGHVYDLLAIDQRRWIVPPRFSIELAMLLGFRPRFSLLQQTPIGFDKECDAYVRSEFMQGRWIEFDEEFPNYSLWTYHILMEHKRQHDDYLSEAYAKKIRDLYVLERMGKERNAPTTGHDLWRICQYLDEKQEAQWSQI